MKKQKTNRPFFYKDMDHQEFVDLINKDIPVNVRYNEDLINRVHARYPFLNKTQISIIVKYIFQSFRDLLVQGKILNFNKLFFDTKLYVFDYRSKGRILPSLKVKISTPPAMKDPNE